MKKNYNVAATKGFTLVELAIVLSVIGVIVAGIWTYARSARQSANIETAAEEIGSIVDGTRTALASLPGINGGVAVVVPQLVAMGALPTQSLRTSPTPCPGIANPQTYADMPFPQNYNNFACGTLRVCDWTLGSDTQCRLGGGIYFQQNFAVEFIAMDFATCVSLAERITPASPSAGLQDIYINGSSGLNVLNGVPIKPAAAMSTGAYAGKGCSNSTSNTVSFVYSLRAPST